MKLTESEETTLKYLSTTAHSEVFIGILNKVLMQYADVRNLKDLSPEYIKATQLACDIIQQDIIKRLTLSNDTGKIEHYEEFE